MQKIGFNKTIIRGAEIMKMGITQVYHKLGEIFNIRFRINFDNQSKKFFDKNLLDDEIGFTPSCLLYLFFDIEKKFDIKIPEEEIVSKNFNSINKIIEIISRQVNSL